MNTAQSIIYRNLNQREARLIFLGFSFDERNIIKLNLDRYVRELENTDSNPNVVKRLLCLANSRKLSGRCVAGREVVNGQPLSLREIFLTLARTFRFKAEPSSQS